MAKRVPHLGPYVLAVNTALYAVRVWEAQTLDELMNLFAERTFSSSAYVPL